MLTVIIVMLAVLALSGLVVLYVAFPGRGEDVPGVPWVGDALGKAVDAMPTLDEEDSDRLIRR